MERHPVKTNRWYQLKTFERALALARILPRPVAQFLASGIGRASWFSHEKAREALRENLRTVTGLHGSQLDALCQRNFANFIRMLADYFYCSSAEPKQITALLGEWRGFENLVAAREGGKGAILITGHLGNWEMGGMLLALRDLPMHVITLSEPSSALTQWRDNFRRRLGIKTIEVGADKFAFVEIIAALRRNELVAMLIDRPYVNSGTPITFFGRPTMFSSAAALLWQYTGAPVLPAFVLQNRDGKYLSIIESPVPMEKASDAETSLAKNAQTMASIFETIIRDYPEQWFNYVPIWND